LFAAAGLSGALLAAAPGANAAVSGGMLSGREFGLEPNAARDQSAPLQRAVDEASRRGGYLLLEPGLYIASGITISSSPCA
jgi:polygalacturonase